ncbi:host attachment protein [Natronospira bacteriovora]|uniref:Host attachment protein n=1 Tax=Natronospira bacteriovora TaxID=3069753 RepID=A0ABU0W526_9GAMM|nr:host attachment protein [Natronospira sp. AB-CW4]MDQ2069096.1 host attachment protein [Natronospira sp. AB-CW4]
MKVEMPKTWVIVADASRARFLDFRGHVSGLEEIHDMVNPEGRMRNQDLVTDKHGTTNDRKGFASPQMGDNAEAAHQVERAFATEVARTLGKMASENAVQSLILVAPPRFLGELRQRLDKKTSALVKQELNKDISTLSPDEIKAHLDRVA